MLVATNISNITTCEKIININIDKIEIYAVTQIYSWCEDTKLSWYSFRCFNLWAQVYDFKTGKRFMKRR